MIETIELDVPSSNGAGAATNVVALGVWKTIVLTGDIVGQISIEASCDGASYVPVHTFASSIGAKSVRLVARFLRVVVANYFAGSGICKVSAQEKINNFETLTVPAGNGVSPSVNVNAAGDIWTVMCSGATFAGALQLEISQDNMVFSPIGRVFTGAGHETRIISAAYARVRRTGYDAFNAGPPTFSLGITPNLAPSVGGGGGGGEEITFDFPLNNIEDFGAISNGDPGDNRLAILAAIADARANDIAGIFVPAGVFGCNHALNIDGNTFDGSFLFSGVRDFLVMGLGPRSILRMEDDPGLDWKFWGLQGLRDQVVIPSGDATGVVKTLSAHETTKRVLTFEVTGGTWNGTATVQTSPDGTGSWTTRGVFTGEGSEEFDSSDGFARVVTSGGHSTGTGQVRIQTPCHRIWFHGITWDGSGVVDPTEQTHMIAIGGGDPSIGGTAEETKITECLFFDTFGDAIRLIGTPPLGSDQHLQVTDILVDSCWGFDNLRVFFSVQRASARVAFTNNYGEGGTDQIVDFEPSGGAAEDMVCSDNILVRTVSNAFLVALSGGSGFFTERTVFARNLVLGGPVFVISNKNLVFEENLIVGHAEATDARPSLSMETSGSYYLVRSNIVIRRMPGIADTIDVGAIIIAGAASSNFVFEENVAIQEGDAHIINVEGLTQAYIRRNCLVYAGESSLTVRGVSIRSTAQAMAFMLVDENTFIGDLNGGLLLEYVQFSASPNRIDFISIRDNIGTGARDGVTWNSTVGVNSFFGSPPLVKNDFEVTGTAFKSLNLLRAVGGGAIQAMAIGGNVAPGSPRILCQSGSPAGVISAPPGSLYYNLAGGTSTTLYVKESGTDASGWIAK